MGLRPTSRHAAGSGFSTAGLNSFGRQDVSMRQEIRVNFTGETTLDNGITVGVLVGLNGENVMKSGNTTQVNRAYADFSGRFGMIRIGETDSALGTDCVADPGNVTSNFGLNSPNESFSNVGYGVVRNQFTGTITPSQPAHAARLLGYGRRRARGRDRDLLRSRIQGQSKQQDPLFLALLRRPHLRRLLHPPGRQPLRRRRPRLWDRCPGAGCRRPRQCPRSSPPITFTTSATGI